MDRDFYLHLARSGARFPIATHLVLHQKEDPDAILFDGARMAQVMSETARRFGSILAFSVMDLSIEKELMVRAMGIATDEVPSYHFEQPPSPEQLRRLEVAEAQAHPRLAADCEALRAISAAGGLVPVGMCIGPFSLLTKLLRDPIIPIFLAGSGLGPDDAEEVALLGSLLPLCETVVASSCRAQIHAGAKAIMVCEPAANLVFFSPNQLEEGSSVFDDFVIRPNLRLKELLNRHGVDLLFHDCGELTTGMVSSFSALDPAIISLGSSVDLGEMEPFIPMSTVIYGNLPTKKFYSDEDVPMDALPDMVGEIESLLGPSGHPFIVGSECDVLSMPGYEKIIMEKVETFCSCDARARETEWRPSSLRGGHHGSCDARAREAESRS